MTRRSTTTRVALAGLVALAALASAPARADDDGGPDVHRYAPDPEGLGIQNVRSVEVLEPWAPALGVHYDLGFEPLEVRFSGAGSDDLVDTQHVLTFAGAVGLPYDLSLGLAVPYFVEQTGDRFDRGAETAGGSIGGAGFGDVRPELAWKAWVSGSRRLGLGVRVFATFPTGNEHRFRGHGELTVGGLGAVEYRLGSRVRLLANAGYQWFADDIPLADAEVGDRLLLGAAVSIALIGPPSAPGEGAAPPLPPLPEVGPPIIERLSEPGPRLRLDLEASIDGSYGLDGGDERLTPFEAWVGLRLDTPRLPLSVVAGASFGVAEDAGAPDVRAFVGVTWSFGWQRRREARLARTAGFFDGG